MFLIERNGITEGKKKEKGNSFLKEGKEERNK